jgi:hypothetical protein
MKICLTIYLHAGSAINSKETETPRSSARKKSWTMRGVFYI